eukprot:4862482-Pleurochrysis_carterae.AAC.1
MKRIANRKTCFRVTHRWSMTSVKAFKNGKAAAWGELEIHYAAPAAENTQVLHATIGDRAVAALVSFANPRSVVVVSEVTRIKCRGKPLIPNETWLCAELNTSNNGTTAAQESVAKVTRILRAE